MANVNRLQVDTDTGVEGMARRMAAEADRRREEFAAAYLVMTDLDPRDAVLVQQQTGAGTLHKTRWYYVAKSDIRGQEDIDALMAENADLRRRLASIAGLVQALGRAAGGADDH